MYACSSLLNAYGLPSNILKLQEHGASFESYDNSLLSESNNLSEPLINNYIPYQNPYQRLIRGWHYQKNTGS